MHETIKQTHFIRKIPIFHSAVSTTILNVIKDRAKTADNHKLTISGHFQQQKIPLEKMAKNRKTKNISQQGRIEFIKKIKMQHT